MHRKLGGNQVRGRVIGCPRIWRRNVMSALHNLPFSDVYVTVSTRSSATDPYSLAWIVWAGGFGLKHRKVSLRAGQSVV